MTGQRLQSQYYSPGYSPGAAASGISCAISSVSSSWKKVMQPVGLCRRLVFEEVQLAISSSLDPTFETVQRSSISVFPQTDASGSVSDEHMITF